jgi:nucleotide-binding universal stress UspA family protein
VRFLATALRRDISKMAFPYKTILCPLDFDENSLAALDGAVEIARHFGSNLILVHVLPLVLSAGEIPPLASMYEDQEKAARAKLDDIAQQKLAGLKHELRVYVGDVIESVLNAQNEHRPDLLVMATHGRRGLARMFLGSVAEAVVRKATCPVLTIRGETPGAHSESTKDPKAGGGLNKLT